MDDYYEEIILLNESLIKMIKPVGNRVDLIGIITHICGEKILSHWNEGCNLILE